MASEVGEETMMMDINQGMYFALNPVGSRIWALLEQATSVKALCEQLLKEYDIDVAQCEQEVMTFIDQLLERKIVSVVAHKADAPSS